MLNYLEYCTDSDHNLVHKKYEFRHKKKKGKCSEISRI